MPIRGRPGACRKPLFEHNLRNMHQAFLDNDNVINTNNSLEDIDRERHREIETERCRDRQTESERKR